MATAFINVLLSWSDSYIRGGDETAIPFVTQTFNVILVGECRVVADQKLQGSVLRMEKETYGGAHRDSFLFKARRGMRATSN